MIFYFKKEENGLYKEHAPYQEMDSMMGWTGWLNKFQRKNEQIN
jgi:hypothetical protein